MCIHSPACRRERAPARGEMNDYYRDEYNEVEDSTGSYRREGWDRRAMKGKKIKIPSFQSKLDSKANLEWQKKMEFGFDCHNYSKAKKVKLDVIKFSDYVVTWWDRLAVNKRQNREHPVET